MLENGIPKKVTYILSNEKGEIISVIDVDPSIISDSYYADIKEELLKEKEREVTITIKNDKD